VVVQHELWTHEADSDCVLKVQDGFTGGCPGETRATWLFRVIGLGGYGGWSLISFYEPLAVIRLKSPTSEHTTPRRGDSSWENHLSASGPGHPEKPCCGGERVARRRGHRVDLPPDFLRVPRAC